MIGNEVEILPSGDFARMGCKLPDTQRFSAVPAWADANEVIPETQWEDHDDYAPLAQPIKTQPFSNCTNASIAGLQELLTVAAGMPAVKISQVMLYWLCNGGSDSGAFCRDIAGKLLEVGNCTDSLCPASRATGNPSSEMLADAASRKGLEIYQCMNFDDVGSALTRRFGVYHGFVLGQKFFGAGSDGIVPSFDGRMANGHAMYSRGLRKINGVWRTVTPNSWGTTFGAQGVGYIDKSYFWQQSGNMVNLDCFAIRALKVKADDVPAAGK